MTAATLQDRVIAGALRHRAGGSEDDVLTTATPLSASRNSTALPDRHDHRILAQVANGLIFGDIGDDVIKGPAAQRRHRRRGESNDDISGGAGNDTINGNVGSDKIHRDEGDDELLGDRRPRHDLRRPRHRLPLGGSETSPSGLALRRSRSARHVRKAGPGAMRSPENCLFAHRPPMKERPAGAVARSRNSRSIAAVDAVPAFRAGVADLPDAGQAARRRQQPQGLSVRGRERRQRRRRP